jgi:hypothetical protein
VEAGAPELVAGVRSRMTDRERLLVELLAIVAALSSLRT